VDVSKSEPLTQPIPILAQQIQSDSQHLILDFDHTLFLSNSTEEYLDCAYPKVLVALVLAFIEGLKPWQLLPQENARFIYRDAIRVWTITLLFPWTLLVWRWKAAQLAQKYGNTEILDIAITHKWTTKVIASNGFKFILVPLLNALTFQYDILISSQFGQLKNGVRGRGKLDILQGNYGDYISFEQASFITDNDDKDLLRVVSNPIQKVWDDARHFRACQNIYIPFVYTEGSNRGNKNHVINTILLTNYLILLMSYGMSSAFSIYNAIALFCLSVSFWCIYEAGYYENDFHEVNHEDTKGEGKKILKFADYPVEVGAWTWGGAIALIGIMVYFSQGAPSLAEWKTYGIGLSVWATWLLIVRLTFRVYNYSQRPLRVLLYPILQMFRLAGPILFLPLNILGISLIVAQATSRWVWYMVYRTGGDRKAAPHHVVRLFIFLAFISLFVATEQSLAPLLTLQFAIMLLWSLSRSASQLRVAFKKAVSAP